MKIKIGTRGSKLALKQTELAAKAILEKFPSAHIEIVVITTKGDKVQDKPLSQIGGTGVFTGEIHRALISREIDLAVHSAKDLPVLLPQGLTVSCVLNRADPRDVLVTNKGVHIEAVPQPVIGTGSLRRRKSFAKLFPNASFADIRGNVDTRLSKLKNGEYDGIILAAAGLERMGYNNTSDYELRYFDAQSFIPAPCQGIIAIESRKNELEDVLSAVNDKNTMLCYRTERQALKLLGGDCSLPAGAIAEISQNNIRLTVTKDCEKILSGESTADECLKLAEGLVKQL